VEGPHAIRQVGPLFVLPLGVLLLLACATASGATDLMGGRVGRRLDQLASAGLFGCALTLYVSVFVAQAARIGAPDSAVHFVGPSAAGIDLGFVAWSLAAVAALLALAVASVRAQAPPSGRRGIKERVERLALPCGVLVAIVVQALGMNAISSTGGQAGAADSSVLAGRMLVPFAIGLCVAFAAGRSSSSRQRQA